MKKKIFVFDWNGTLLNDTVCNLLGFNATLNLFGRAPVDLTQYRNTMDFPLVNVYTRNGVDRDTYLSKFQEATDVFFDTYRPAAEKATLADGTIELLSQVHDMGFELLILSNQNNKDLHAQIEQRGIIQHFHQISGNFDNSITGYTDTNKLSRLKAILAKGNYDLGQSFIIGDSLEEPEIAHDLGLNCISVTYGCFSRERLEQSPTHYVIDDLAQAREILQKSVLERAL